LIFDLEEDVIMVKQIRVFFISGIIFFCSFAFFICDFQSKAEKQERDKQQRFSRYLTLKIVNVAPTPSLPQRAILNRQEPTTTFPLQKEKGLAELPSFILDVEFLKLLTLWDIFYLLAMWASGIFFTIATTRLAKRCC
jgi:hypothetical protein